MPGTNPGQYILSFDDSLTGRICCYNVPGYQQTCLTYVNQALLDFAMQVAVPQISCDASISGNTASAQVSISSAPNYSYTLGINWGDGTPIEIVATNDSSGSGTHSYENPGTYLVVGYLNRTSPPAQVGELVSQGVKLTVNPPPPVVSLLEFYKAPNSGWVVYNHQYGSGIASNPFGLLNGNNVSVFVQGSDGSLLEFFKAPNPAPWLVYNHSNDTGINGQKIGGRPFAILNGDSLSVFTRGTDGSFLEFYEAPIPARWVLYNHSNDIGINGQKIGGSPFALLNGGNVSVFAKGSDSSFLEFYKAPYPAPWVLYNHSDNAGINGQKIASSPFALLNGGNVSVFAQGGDGSFLEFYKAPNPAPWMLYNHSNDPGINGQKIASSPFALLNGGNVSVFAQGGDGSFLEFYKAPNPAPWVLYNHSNDPGINRQLISGYPFAILSSGSADVYCMS